MTAQDSAVALPAQLATELAGLSPFADIFAATAAVNNGIRARYLSRLYSFASAGKLSDRLVIDIGTAINTACDRAVALALPVHAAQSFPQSQLTKAERDALK